MGSQFNPLRMSFPSFSTKSNASFLSNSIQNSHSNTRSLKSLHSSSTLSSRMSTTNLLKKSNVNDSCVQISRKPVDPRKQPDDNEDMQMIQTPTIMSKHIRNVNPNVNVSSATDSTLVQSSYLSMGNIDTPITIENPHKFVKKSQPSLNDSTFPMTPTKMPNLSMINIKEEDNIAVSDDESVQLQNLQSDIDREPNNELYDDRNDDEEKNEQLETSTGE